MKLFGYSDQGTEELLTLKEVTFNITATQAKYLAEFFLKCSVEMNVPDWSHEHFGNGSCPDVIVYCNHEQTAPSSK